MSERWAVFSVHGSLCVEKVRTVGKTWLTWGNEDRGGRVNIVLVHGLFPSFENADDARMAARDAMARALEEGASSLICGKRAIKSALGFMAVNP